jgi:hypothetical protein
MFEGGACYKHLRRIEAVSSTDRSSPAGLCGAASVDIDDFAPAEVA